MKHLATLTATGLFLSIAFVDVMSPLGMGVLAVVGVAAIVLVRRMS